MKPTMENAVKAFKEPTAENTLNAVEECFANIAKFTKSAQKAKLTPFIKMKPRLVKKLEWGGNRMNIQKESWVMLQDRKFHYQKKGKILCGIGGLYALFEESNPPKKDRCKECMQKLK